MQNFKRARARSPEKVVSLAEFLPRHLLWMTKKRKEFGPLRSPRLQEKPDRWVVVIHRKDLTPDLEKSWREKIKAEDRFSVRFRLNLRGLWKLESQ